MDDGDARVTRLPKARMRPIQFLATGLGFLAVLIDGFDTQAIAFAGPLLKRELASGSGGLGIIFGMAILGSVTGAWVGGPLGDRVGRRPLIIAALAIISLGSFGSALAGSVLQLALVRFFTGIGLGAAIPNVIALAAEYAPPRMRSTVVAAVFNGFPIGATLGSVVSAQILPRFGWRALFELGGILPAFLLVVAVALLPESLQILKRRAAPAAFDRTVERLGEMAALVADEPMAPTSGAGANSLAQLFSRELAASTLLIWLATFLSILCLYCTINWLPTLASEAGLPMQTAILAVGLLNISSILGNLILARFADRSSPYLPTACFYAVGAMFLAALGVSAGSAAATLGVAFATGLLMFGAQLSLTTITSRIYPVHIRATGIGWANGVGRLGGSIGPVATGLLVAGGLGFAALMIGIGALAFLAGVVVLFLGRVQRASGRSYVMGAGR